MYKIFWKGGGGGPRAGIKVSLLLLLRLFVFFEGKTKQADSLYYVSLAWRLLLSLKMICLWSISLSGKTRSFSLSISLFLLSLFFFLTYF